MKKNFVLIFLLLCLPIVSYSEEVNKIEGKKILEKMRMEIQNEEKIKEETAKRAKEAEEKIRIATKKAEEEKGKKLLEEKRRNLNESLEEKVFRSENTPKARMAAAGKAFEIGKERMDFLRLEEEEIMQLEEALGIEDDESRIFLSKKFGEVYDTFKNNDSEIKQLLLENEKLNERLAKLNRMEQKIKKRN